MLTAEQIEERRGWMGASDIAAIAGLNPYANAHDVYLEKTGRLTPASSEAMNAGSRFETPVLDWAEEELGPLERDLLLPAPDGLPIVARLDAMLHEDRAPVEAKTGGLFGPIDSTLWGDEGTDEVPAPYIVQVQIQMFCSGACRGHLAAFLGGRGFRMYQIDRADDLIETLVERAVKFWTDCVQADTPPTDIAPHIETVKRLYRKSGVEVEIAPELVAAWHEAAADAKAHQELADVAKARLLAALGDGEVGLAGDIGRVTYYEQTRKAHEVAESTFRVLRFSKPKGKKR